MTTNDQLMPGQNLPARDLSPVFTPPAQGGDTDAGEHSGENGHKETVRKTLQKAFAVAPESMIPIGDIIFDNVSMSEAVERVVEMARKTDRPRYVCTANLDHMALCEKDEEFREIYRRADLVLADGMPVVWLSQSHVMGSLQARVAGSDLFFELARASSTHRLRLFFLGGSPGSADKAAEAVQLLYPKALVSGTYCPSFENFDTDAEQAKIAACIKDANPHILFVGLGAPKQEKWISKYKNAVRVPVSIGVGGSFEMAAGVIKRAPVWMQKSGLEWSYRLAQEPKRLWHRYVGRDMPYLLGLVPSAAKMATFRLGSAMGNLKPDASTPLPPNKNVE